MANAVELGARELPATCPPAGAPLWGLHPRIFLDVVNQDEAMCPYCCTSYRLRPEGRLHDRDFDARCLHQHRRHARHQPRR